MANPHTKSPVLDVCIQSGRPWTGSHTEDDCPPRGAKDENMDQVENRLAWWYREEQEHDRSMALAKRQEYGSADLRLMAAAMREMLPHPNPGALEGCYGDDEEGYYIEAAVAFYALGKISRITGAFAEGRVPSLDSWQDTTVYSMMARRVRENGSW